MFEISCNYFKTALYYNQVMKICVLDKSKICDDCGLCEDRCELDPSKICDNCFKCLDNIVDGMDRTPYAEIKIKSVFSNSEVDLSEDEMVPIRNHYIDAQTLYGLHGRRKVQ